MGDSPYGGAVNDVPKEAAASRATPAPVPEPVKADANGFEPSIAWESLDSALARSKAADRPVMMVVHADWCGRCKELKPKFSDEEIVKLSEDFIMVNLNQDFEPRSLEYTPDGDYVPRVMFVDPKTQKVDEDFLNARRTRTRYFYTPADDLAGVMKKARTKYERT